MNQKNGDKDTTQCGYAGSDMVGILNKDSSCSVKSETGENSTLDEIYETYIKNDFDNDSNKHVLTYQNLLSNKTDENATNRMGNSNLKGASSYFGFYTRKLDLMSEMNVYGGIVSSSSMWDTGIDNRQYAIFRLKPELINSYNGEQFIYWLKDVASSAIFSEVWSAGNSGAETAEHSRGVRPRFLICSLQ